MRKEVQDALYFLESAIQPGTQQLSDTSSLNGVLSEQASERFIEQLAPYHNLARLRYNQLSHCLNNTFAN